MMVVSWCEKKCCLFAVNKSYFDRIVGREGAVEDGAASRRAPSVDKEGCAVVDALVDGLLQVLGYADAVQFFVVVEGAVVAVVGGEIVVDEDIK